MNTQSKWYAVYTRPRWEKKVADLLTRKKITHYCPVNRVRRQWSDRKKTIYEPLFTSYVFVRLTPEQFLSVRQTDGVINFVYWLGQPAVIRDEEITAIQDFLSEHVNVQLEKTKVNVNDTVRIISGPLMNREGNVIEIMNRSVKVVLPSLGYSLVAQVSKSQVEQVEVAV